MFCLLKRRVIIVVEGRSDQSQEEDDRWPCFHVWTAFEEKIEVQTLKVFCAVKVSI